VQSTNQWHNWMFELEEKCSWRRPTGLCRWPTGQHSRKKLENWWWIQVWMAILKPHINRVGKYLE